MRQSEADDFRSYVAVRMDRWRRTAYLLCQDWHASDDLVSILVAKLYQHWGRVAVADNRDAYAQRMLTRVWLDERRRPWAREQPQERLPETGYDTVDGVTDRDRLGRLLAGLGRRQRAVVVLRFYLDYSVEETAELLGISPGTVKSQSARALQAVRALAAAGTEDGR
ncbi:SigE family RNA polymerase sigma factor [Dactylosporangium matsuzakiense]|uniref:RNA polymerase sigma24 factor n=1 Tax=Dactylosporangium matsuzakiense TaxID=53360 RepID=A0A9W6KVX0_9ACTN|nr:SigE family RNA polymerase sigma factor [Dactylosporangium matsuzakiense]UWZ47997.1 SigE family RNA polymerase sigma factor [Dactylosporangium matsuzakiense]GLL07684.1 RNA polymerase sigma24 factor [Dactylosporangium matsuzakiense]